MYAQAVLCWTWSETPKTGFPAFGFILAATRENWSSGFPTRPETNWLVQLQRMVRNLKVQIYKEEE